MMPPPISRIRLLRACEPQGWPRRDAAVPTRGYDATPVEGETTYTVDEAAAILQETPQRVREMLVTGELEGIPPGATHSGEWKVLLPASAGAGGELGQQVLADESAESAPADQGEAPPAEEGAEKFVEPPQTTADAEGELPATEPISRGDNADIAQEIASSSGWMSTQQAAKALGISPRTVRWHIEQGNLQAKPEGEGVRRTWLVSIDSFHAFRNARQAAGELPQPSRREAESADIAVEGLGNAIRELADRLAVEAARAAEYRVRLELTEQAESTLRAELEETRRRREALERERDELRRELEALKEQRESPVSPRPTETPAEPSGGAQEAREATQSAAETLRGPPERPPPIAGAQLGPQRPAQPGLRGRLWRRVFGR
jgi:DNA-binding transcriptional MerR regulator